MRKKRRRKSASVAARFNGLATTPCCADELCNTAAVPELSRVSCDLSNQHWVAHLTAENLCESYRPSCFQTASHPAAETLEPLLLLLLLQAQTTVWWTPSKLCCMRRPCMPLHHPAPYCQHLGLTRQESIAPFKLQLCIPVVCCTAHLPAAKTDADTADAHRAKPLRHTYAKQ